MITILMMMMIMMMMLLQGVSDTVWKVGCYKINPSTPSGQKFFILHMLVLPLIPITALGKTEKGTEKLKSVKV